MGFQNVVILSVLALVIIVILGLVLGCVIDYKKFLREIGKKKEEKRNIIKRRLTLTLKSICVQLGIPLTYHDDLGTAAGRILYHKNGLGRLKLDDARIEVLTKYENDPWVLAHELGHYMAIKQREDPYEKAADE